MYIKKYMLLSTSNVNF